MLESKVHLVPEAQKENEGHKEHLVPLGLKVQKEKLVLTEDLAELGLPVPQDPQEIEEHQDCQVRRDQ